MTQEKTTVHVDASDWFSTYGMLTSQRLLEQFHLKLAPDEWQDALKNTQSLYHRFLQVPLKNIFNGIVLGQARDYQIYAQKLIIDHLLSPEAAVAEDSPGASTREDLEIERKRLLDMNEAFSKEDLAHQKLIADTQARLIALSKALKTAIEAASKTIQTALRKVGFNNDLQKIQTALKSAMVYQMPRASNSPEFYQAFAKKLALDASVSVASVFAGIDALFEGIEQDLQGLLSTFLEKVNDQGILIRSYRTQFYDLILRATELIKLLPDYRINEANEEALRESLHFDARIGGE